MNFMIEVFIGGLTLGMYHHYVSMKQIKEHNDKIEKQHKEFRDKMNIINLYFLN